MEKEEKKKNGWGWGAVIPGIEHKSHLFFSQILIYCNGPNWKDEHHRVLVFLSIEKAFRRFGDVACVQIIQVITLVMLHVANAHTAGTRYPSESVKNKNKNKRRETFRKVQLLQVLL